MIVVVGWQTDYIPKYFNCKFVAISEEQVALKELAGKAIQDSS